MGKKAYLGIDNIARKVKKMYIGVNGVARKVKKGYIGIDGVARLFFSGLGTPMKVGTAPNLTSGGAYPGHAENNSYAIFCPNVSAGNVCAYNSNLIKTEPETITRQGRDGYFSQICYTNDYDAGQRPGVSISDYAIFFGTPYNQYHVNGEYYNSSLVKNTITLSIQGFSTFTGGMTSFIQIGRSKSKILISCKDSFGRTISNNILNSDLVLTSLSETSFRFKSFVLNNSTITTGGDFDTESNLSLVYPSGLKAINESGIFSNVPATLKIYSETSGCRNLLTENHSLLFGKYNGDPNKFKVDCFDNNYVYSNPWELPDVSIDSAVGYNSGFGFIFGARNGVNVGYTTRVSVVTPDLVLTATDMYNSDYVYGRQGVANVGKYTLVGGGAGSNSGYSWCDVYTVD